MSNFIVRTESGHLYELIEYIFHKRKVFLINQVGSDQYGVVWFFANIKTSSLVVAGHGAPERYYRLANGEKLQFQSAAGRYPNFQELQSQLANGSAKEHSILFYLTPQAEVITIDSHAHIEISNTTRITEMFMKVH